jgi:hypothetical protein
VRVARFTGLVLALLALSAQPAFAEGRSVTRRVQLREGANAFTVSCPRKFAALNGGTYPTASDVLPSISAPGKGLRQWRFGFDAGGPANVRVVVRCERLKFPRRVHAKFQVHTAAKNKLTVGSGATRKVTLRCPKGHVPTGYGQNQTPTGEGQDRDAGAIDFYLVKATKRGFVFGLRNQSTETAQVDLFIRCLRRKLRGRLAKVRVRKFKRQTVPANGSRRLRHACRRGDFALATGWSFGSGSGVALTSTRPAGKRRARWAFDNGGDRAKVRTSILCLARQR